MQSDGPAVFKFVVLKFYQVAGQEAHYRPLSVAIDSVMILCSPVDFFDNTPNIR